MGEAFQYSTPMSLLGVVHTFVARECGADAADEAVVEYVAETVRGADAADAWQDLDELLTGLSPDVWGGHSKDQRLVLLLHLWGMVRHKMCAISCVKRSTHRLNVPSRSDGQSHSLLVDAADGSVNVARHMDIAPLDCTSMFSEVSC